MNDDQLPTEMMDHLRALTRFVYFVTDEEDNFLLKLRDIIKKYEDRTWVFNAALGMVPIKQLFSDWANRTHTESPDTQSIHDALIKVYKDDPLDKQNFYVFTDPDRFLADPHVVRRFVNIIHQLHNDDRTIKIVLFVGPRLFIPRALQRYIEVVHDTGLNEAQIVTCLDNICTKLKLETRPPKGIEKHFKGLTSWEVDMACAQSIIKTKKDRHNPRRIDPKLVGDFKRKQLAKTDLLSYIDVSSESFDILGGCERFKEWANKTKASWTEEGQKFGLRPPKGVLCVGVWGCGKSLSIKATAHAWRMPLIQLEMGRLRSSGVGESEANVYRAIALIEAVSPCVVWIDEAEKSLAGNQSSARSDAGTTARTIGILSTWIQETKSHVCLAMTANALSTLPVEFINRMDERFFFDLPSDEERIEILKIHLRKRGQDPESYQLADLAEAANHMVGREIEQSIGAALVDSFDQGCDALSHDILLKEVRSKPRIFKTMVDELREVLEWVGYDPDVDDGIRARFASKDRSDTFKQFRVSADG